MVVLCHTRELAFQISKEYERFSKYMPTVKVGVFFGGRNASSLVNYWIRLRRSNGHKNSNEQILLSLEFAKEITPRITYRSCLLIYEIAIVASLPFGFMDDFEGNSIESSFPKQPSNYHFIFYTFEILLRRLALLPNAE